MSQPSDTSEVAKRRGPRKKGKLNDATSALQPVAQVERLTTAPSEPQLKTKSKHQKRKVDDTTVVAKRWSPRKKGELIVEDNNHFGNSDCYITDAVSSNVREVVVTHNQEVKSSCHIDGDTVHVFEIESRAVDKVAKSTLSKG